MKKKILSICGSILVTGIFVGIANYLNQTYFPLPPGVSMENKPALELYLKYLPGGAFAITFSGMMLGGFAGAFTAVMIDGIDGGRHALLVASLFTLYGVVGMLMVAHPWPLWFINLFTYLSFGIMGSKTAFKVRG
ncbi:MAG: hypothetical protein WDA22_16700 [Bacteroidota bacterium]